LSIHNFPTQKELEDMAQASPSPDSTDPQKMILVLRDKLEANPDPMCLDDKPIHWVIARAKEGLIIQDSGAIGPQFQFRLSGIGELSRESLKDLCEVVLAWLADLAPMSKGWGVQFVDTDPLEVGREIVN
jgi:hypothetical protein